MFHAEKGRGAWLADRRLNQTPLPNLQRAEVPDPAPPPTPTDPLQSRDELVNSLWRLGLVDEAWDQWRRISAQDKTPSYPDQLVEGRLRMAIGDPWTGLDNLFRLSLRWRHPDCEQRALLQRSQSPRMFRSLYESAAQEQTVSLNLLYGISKQESRFSPGVSSVAGARGVMQLMPATAEELAGRNLSDADLADYAFRYEVQINNARDAPVGVLGRRWEMIDGRGGPHEEEGEGIGGEAELGKVKLEAGRGVRFTGILRVPTPKANVAGHYWVKLDLSADVGEEGVMAIVGPLGASTDGKPVEPIKPLGFLLESE